MEARSQAAPGAGARGGGRRSAWLAGLVPLAVLGAAIGLFAALGAPGLDRPGVPQEEIAVERTVLKPGEIELHVRNDGADPVEIEQAIVNDGFADFTQSHESIGRLGASTITIQYPWIEGEAYEVALLTSTGGTVESSIDVAVESPDADLGFYGLMALIGIYVGVIPVAIGMLWLPWVRRIDRRWIQFVLALTAGLLAFLGIDAILEGVEFADAGAAAFGGPVLVYVGAIVAYLLLSGVDAWLRRRRDDEGDRDADGGAAAVPGFKLALLIAIGIGLHNLGEGLAIGSAYAVGSLALGAALIVGFALHNTTEGLAIVAPVAGSRGEGTGGTGAPPAVRALLPRLVALGLIAGAPAILGAFIGASAFNTNLAAFLFGLGAGAIAQVIVQLLPALRDSAGRLLHPLAVGGLLTGIAIMYLTGLLITA